MSVLSQIRQGEIDAKKSASAKRKGAKSAGRAHTKSAGRASTRSAGRASAARGGIGIVLKTLKHRKSAGGTLRYVFQKDKNPQIVSTNCGNQKDTFKLMELTSKLRPDIQNKIGHLVVSLPIQVGRGEERWEQFIDRLREEIGLTNDFPYTAARHFDGDADHAHLIYSRISVHGECHNSDNLGLRLAIAAEKIEKEFQLKLFPRKEVQNKISKNEIELGLRTGKLPPRLQIAAALKIAIQGKPTVQQFVERLNAAGVGVKANVASTGKMSGFSFSYDGIAFSGSKISKEFGWKSLSTQIDYNPDRDAELLKILDGEPGTANRDLAIANRVVTALSEAVESVKTSEKEAGHEQQNRGVAQVASVNSRTGETDSRNAESAPALGGRDHEPSEIRPAATDERPDQASDPATVDRASQLPGRSTEKTARPNTVRTAQKPPVLAAVAEPVEPARLITSPDLKSERWMRSARLLDEYRRGIKSKTDIADLDRLASDAGHDPADIISAHAVAIDKLPSEIAQDVLKNAPTPEMREYIQKEFEASKKRFEASKSDNRHNDDQGMRPGGM
jgi:hypothetical protein